MTGAEPAAAELELADEPVKLPESLQPPRAANTAETAIAAKPIRTHVRISTAPIHDDSQSAITATPLSAPADRKICAPASRRVCPSSTVNYAMT